MSIAGGDVSVKFKIDDIIDKFKVSDRDHERWYGEKKIADEMEKE